MSPRPQPMPPAAAPPPFPNAKARLRVAARWPATPPREHFLTIWTRDLQFRVRDESGRHVSAILADVEAQRGLGAPPRTMEDFMDAQSRPARPRGSGTDLFGDLASSAGLVVRAGQAPWAMAAERLAPAARQILAGDGAPGEPASRRPCVRLGRPATEIRSTAAGVDNGAPYRNAVTRVVSPPYLLFSHVHDARDPGHYYTREIVSLEEGTVSDPDLAPPPSIS